jgi:cyclase
MYLRYASVIVVAAAMLAAAGCGPKMRPISDNIILAEGAPPGPNSGVVKTPFGSVVIDGQPGYRAAQGLLKAAHKRTGWEVSYLIMTSHHADHSLGNEVFRKAEIISTAAARKAFNERVPGERKMLARRLKLSGLKGIEYMPPTMTFEKALTMHAGWPKKKLVEIRLLEMPHGAAPGNLVVYLPDEKVLFGGDLLTGGVFPYMGDADVSEWAKALDRIEKLDIKMLVPGHGRSGGKKLLIWETRKLLADLCAAVLKARKSGVPAEQARKALKLPGYEKWPACKELLPIAVKRLWDQKLPEIKPGPRPQPQAKSRKASKPKKTSRKK